MTLYERYLKWRMCDAAFAIYLALDDMEAWIGDSYRAKHVRSDIELWIANGQSHIHVEKPAKVEFTKFERRHLWRRYESWGSRAIAVNLYKAMIGE